MSPARRRRHGAAPAGAVSLPSYPQGSSLDREEIAPEPKLKTSVNRQVRPLKAQNLQNEPRRSQVTSTKAREGFTKLRLPSLMFFTSHLSTCPSGVDETRTSLDEGGEASTEAQGFDEGRRA